AGLSHSGLVTVLDAGITSEQPYLVMEFVEGPTLKQRCAEQALDAQLVADIGAQVAEALAYAHAQGVVHRDVKPANVLLGPKGRTKLADFGIARLIGDTVRHTQTGHAIGTAAYLAPEQVRGDEITPAVDVYSLGLVLLEALTGERAYPGTPTESALARLSRAPHIPDSLTPPWRQLIAAMTATEPTDRPTAAQAATELRTAGRAASSPAGMATRLMPAVTPTASSPRPAATTSVAKARTVPPFIDRAGDELSRKTARIAARLAETPPHLRGAAAAVLAIVVFVLIVALASGTDDGSSSGSSGSPSGNAIPAQTPDHLRAPLQDLHDAVEGSGS
ncbi:MAG TPA: protein kinase, partial [Nocardioides sp.]|nr:protein kinase [Nocardioides sp.]